MDPDLITAIATLLTAIATLYKVLQHDGILKDTQQRVDGQAASLESLAGQQRASQVRLDASVKTMENENSARANTSA